MRIAQVDGRQSLKRETSSFEALPHGLIKDQVGLGPRHASELGKALPGAAGKAEDDLLNGALVVK